MEESSGRKKKITQEATVKDVSARHGSAVRGATRRQMPYYKCVNDKPAEGDGSDQQQRRQQRRLINTLRSWLLIGKFSLALPFCEPPPPPPLEAEKP